MSHDNFDIKDRYDLLCRASNAQQDVNPRFLKVESQLAELDKLIAQDLVALARRGSPDNFADILQSLQMEMERFRGFCEFPALEAKVVVGIGGSFSAGKSSLINAILGKKRLAVEVDPTTSVPTYLMHGEKDEITALNIFQRRVRLSQNEFLSLTHEEKQRYGSQVGSLLKSAFICDTEFSWRNLALLDTPGYSKAEDEESDRTDAHVAKAQLDSAQFIVWVVAIDSGTILEQDLAFLSSLRSDIPRLIVLTRADKKTPADVASVVGLVRKTLADRALAAIDVVAVSTRKNEDFPAAQVSAHFNAWNAEPRELAFARNFKRQFVIYAKFIEAEQRKVNSRLYRINRLLALANEAELVTEAEALAVAAKTDIGRCDDIAEKLHELRQIFFKKLKQVGDEVGIPLPEPGDIELIDAQGVDLISMLRQINQQENIQEADYSHYWHPLSLPETPSHLAQLLRRTSSRYLPQLAVLKQGGDVTRLHEILGSAPAQEMPSRLSR